MSRPSREQILTSIVSLMVAALVLGAVAAWSIRRFGSISSALHYARGEEISVNTQVVDFGRCAEKSRASREVMVTNNAGDSRVLLAALSTCDCTVVERLPATLVPAKPLPITISTEAGASGSKTEQILTLITNSRQTPQIRLKVLVEAVPVQKVVAGAFEPRPLPR